MPVIKISDNAKKVFMEYERLFNSTRSKLEKTGQEPALLLAVASATEKLQREQEARDAAMTKAGV